MDTKLAFQKEQEQHETRVRNLSEQAIALDKSIKSKQAEFEDITNKTKEAKDTFDSIKSKLKDKYYTEEIRLANVARALDDREKKLDLKDKELSEREDNVKIRENSVKNEEAELETSKENIKTILSELGTAIGLSIKNATNQV